MGQNFSKFAYNTRLGGVGDTPEGHDAVQWLEKWNYSNFINFTEGNC